MTGRIKFLSDDELELRRDEYNLLVIKETQLLKEYVDAPRVAKPTIAKRLHAAAMQLCRLQMIIDKNINPYTGRKIKNKSSQHNHSKGQST